MRPCPGEESAVDDFAVLLRLLGDEPRGTALRSRKDIGLHICGPVCTPRQISGISRTFHFLLVQEDKHLERAGDAEAIATFQVNNEKRRFNEGPVLDEALIPGILMIETAPVFYNIRVTTERWH
jgi:hypothetical protein